MSCDERDMKQARDFVSAIEQKTRHLLKPMYHKKGVIIKRCGRFYEVQENGSEKRIK